MKKSNLSICSLCGCYGFHACLSKKSKWTEIKKTELLEVLLRYEKLKQSTIK